MRDVKDRNDGRKVKLDVCVCGGGGGGGGGGGAVSTNISRPTYTWCHECEKISFPLFYFHSLGERGRLGTRLTQ